MQQVLNSKMHLISNVFPQRGSAFHFELQLFPLHRMENGSVFSAHNKGTRVEPALNSEYAPTSELCLITRDYGTSPVYSRS